LLSYSPVVNVANSILRGATADVVARSDKNFIGRVELSHSNYRPAHTEANMAEEIKDLGANQSLEPLLAPDFNELAGSPTVDAGVLDERVGTSTLDGVARTLGAAPDIGAYELVPVVQPPAPAPAGNPGSAPAPPAGSAGTAGGRGLSVLERLACAGAPGQSCSFAITLTTTEHLKGSRLLGVTARAPRRHTRKVVVGLLRVTLQAGQAKTVKVSLNHAGRGLVARFRRLPVTVTTTSSSAGKTVRLAARRLTLAPPRKHRR
jgi:hypothetical protein